MGACHLIAFSVRRCLLAAGVVFVCMPTPARGDPSVPFICNPFPPQKIENGAPDKPGFDVEIVREALRRSGKTARFAYAPWGRAYAMAASGEYAGLCSCSYRTERTKDFLFTEELGEVLVGFFTRKGAGLRPLALEDLAGKAVGVVRGYNLSAELDEKRISYVDVTDESLLVKLLARDRIDVAYSYRDSFLYHAREAGNVDLFAYWKFRRSPYFVCVSRAREGAEQLRDTLNAGLRALKAEGALDAIRAGYIGTSR